MIAQNIDKILHRKVLIGTSNIRNHNEQIGIIDVFFLLIVC